MKVTVCFGTVRVVVPCGSGDLLVCDLIHEATRRYKKAAGKDQESWVIVHHLQSQSGILDPDDKVSDVADDREQILASFEDTGPDPGVPQGGGDGASGSSVGTGSPDIFRGPAEQKYEPDNNTPHIEVTGTNASNSGLLLQVRRSSDPSLHQIGLDPRNPILNSVKQQQQDPTKRWSAAPVCRSDAAAAGEQTTQAERIIMNSNDRKGGFLSPSWESELEEPQPAEPAVQNQFSRSGRLSMQFLGDGNGYKWIDAAEKVQATSYSSKSLPREIKRKEPLGQAYESMREKAGEMLLIVNEYGGPLGLTAIPDIENGGLLVQNVELGSRAEQGRLRRGDRILEINGIKLVGLSEGSVQDHLRRSCSAPELRLRVIRASTLVKRLQKEISEMTEAQSGGTKVATVSPTRKAPGNQMTSLQVANTRKLGRKIEITLRKGAYGLGFSVTTRDNPAGGHCPIYIKNVLPRGAAIEDGRLKPGDRLLEVDGVPMTGKSQTDVVGILRATQSGAIVNIVVSRQQEISEMDEREIGYSENEQDMDNTTPPKPPAPVLPLKPALRSPSKAKKHIDLNDSIEKHFVETGSDSASSNDSVQIFPWRNREVLTLHVPVHDTEKAGLGLSVKGKTGSNNSSTGSSNSSGATKHDGDLGIFVKNIFHGGAAHKDGRLKMNDQLLNVNGISLLGQSNAEAMETLRKALLHTGGKYPGMITLTVSRRITRPNSTILETYDVANHSRSVSSTSEQSGKTVIYLSSEKLEQNCPTNGQQKLNLISNQNHRWSNPVLDRLTGGTGHMPPPPTQSHQMHHNQRPSPIISSSHGLRNESYYMATNEAWSPTIMMNGNNSVLIEEDPEPTSPTLPLVNMQKLSSPKGDTTYDSQLSLETNPPVDAFSRDAIGRRSMSEKHHAALDAKETGTYQRNKKLREQRERERRLQSGMNAMGSMDSLSSNANEAMDRVGELGPSLGLKKSSSLESLQTMVQEIQMSDEPRGPMALRTPRGRGRDESLRAAVERPSENKPRKHWLLEDGPSDTEGGFTNRNGPFQSSLNEGKHKQPRNKKPGLLKGIGHMFRFGKHRKDGIAPVTDKLSDLGGHQQPHPPPTDVSLQKLALHQAHALNDRPLGGPPTYQPPPPVSNGGTAAIHQNDVFNHRYSHYVNYDELQNQISSERLSESTIAQMRRQVMHQRVKVEEESRRNQHYHSQRSTRTVDIPPPNQPITQINNYHHQQRPASNYYEYETVHQNGHVMTNGSATTANPLTSSLRKTSIPSAVSPKWNGPMGGSGRGTLNRGPFITQVTIRDQQQQQQQQSHIVTQHLLHSHGQQPASKV